MLLYNVAASLLLKKFKNMRELLKLFNLDDLKQSGLLLFVCLVSTTTVFAQSDAQPASVLSDNSHFRISYISKHEPIPLNQIHRWILHVEDMDGQPVENAIVTIDGGMPAHNHGLPTQPIATNIGNGDYLVEGIKFSMTGLWEMRFYIQTDAITDRVMFELEF